jgi:hypothetical protein
MIPRPLQKPRIPIWVAGVWQKPKSAWDGLISTGGKKSKRASEIVKLFSEAGATWCVEV